MTAQNRILIIVDPQNDFVTGSLPVPGAAEALNLLADFITEGGAKKYVHTIVTLDHHPATHCSFETNGGSWPEHCVAGSAGAAIWNPLKDALSGHGKRCTSLPKGTNQTREEFSIFQNILSRDRILEIADEHGAVGADICGLAGDYCVKETYLDALRIFDGNNVGLLPQFIASTDGGKTINQLQKQI